ncbi:MAG: hypothetical protein IK016_06950 [Lachnospiraceae bacterium]|nr:hypothetical protein [Lachnospiraceae bacterium]
MKGIRAGCMLLTACLLTACTPKAQPLPEGEGITEEIASLQSMPSSDETNLRQMFSITDEPPQTPATEYAYHLEAPQDGPELVKNMIILDGEVPQPLQRRIGRFNKDQKDYYMQFAGSKYYWEEEYDPVSGALLAERHFQVYSMNSLVVSFMEMRRSVTLMDSAAEPGTYEYYYAYNIDPEIGCDVQLHRVVTDLRRLSQLLSERMRESFVDALPAGDPVRQQLEMTLTEELIREQLELTLVRCNEVMIAWVIDAEGIEVFFPCTLFGTVGMEQPFYSGRVNFAEAPELFNPRYSGIRVSDPPKGAVKSVAQIGRAKAEAARVLFKVEAPKIAGVIWPDVPEEMLQAGYPEYVIDADAERVIAIEALHDETTLTVLSGKKKRGTGQQDYWDSDGTLETISMNAGDVILLRIDVPYANATRCLHLLTTADTYSAAEMLTEAMIGEGAVWWQVEEVSGTDLFPGYDFCSLELWYEFFNQ